MEQKQFDLNLLKIVQAVAQHGTISKAAEKLNVTQPAVSNALARLREITGDPVFIRGRQGQLPTEYGKSLIELSRNVLSQVRACMENAADFDPSKQTRTFRIAIDDYLETSLIPHFLNVISPYLENIRLRLVSIKSLDLADAMEADEIDLSISSWVDTSHSYKRIRFEKLLEDPVCVAVPEFNEIAQKTELSRTDFLGLKYVIVRPDFTRYQMPEVQLRAIGINRDVAVEIARASSLTSVAVGGNYAITVPRMLFGPMIKYYRMKTFDMPFDFPPISIVAGHHIRDADNPSVKWLRKKMRETAQAIIATSKQEKFI